MRDLAQRILRTIRKQEFLRAGDRVAVAVSGGADSVALLFLLNELRAELGIVLSVAHVNHKLRAAESDGDEQFVAELAARLGLELHKLDAPIPFGKASDGAEVRSRVEAAARELRYRFFRNLGQAGRVSKIATAHTLEDQAETVLLRMFRGTGIRGLAGIHPRLRLDDGDQVVTGEVVRPLLGFRRLELREYLRAQGQKWREDSSNSDETFLRNRVRHRLLPVIEAEFGAAAIEHMAELAEIARAEEEAVVSSQLPVLSQAPATLAVEPLLGLPLATSRRCVRSWVEANAPQVRISFRLVVEILDLARGPAGKTLELPGTTGGANPSRNIVRRGRNDLVLESASGEASDYEHALPVPGEIAVSELGTLFEARLVEMQEVPEPERDYLLNPEQVHGEIVIRNWRPGDRYWPAHTSAEKRVKELLGDRHATGSAKKLWPVVVVDGQLVWMRGFAAPEAWRARSGQAIWIREKAGLM